MSLDDLIRSVHERFDAKTAARERALPAARRSIRASANSIRAIHRGEADRAKELLADSRSAIDEGLEAVAGQPDVRFAGYLQDAQKEYAEAQITFALLRGEPIPGPQEVDVEDAPYLNGMAEAIGEGRRHVLDLLGAATSSGASRSSTRSRISTARSSRWTIRTPSRSTCDARRMWPGA